MLVTPSKTTLRGTALRCGSPFFVRNSSAMGSFEYMLFALEFLARSRRGNVESHALTSEPSDGKANPRAPLGAAWFGLFAAAVAVLAHATALGGGFVWLDHAHLVEGLATAPPAGWAGLFTSGFAGTGYYRPLLSLSLSIDALVGAAWFYHLINALWHAAASASVAPLAEALGLSRRTSRVAALLFAVHPAGSIVASAIAFRAESMIVVALAWLVIFFLRGRPFAAAACLLAGASTKESALVLGPLFLVAIVLSKRAGSAVTPPRRWVVIGSVGVALAMALVMRAAFAPAWRGDLVPLEGSAVLGTRLAALARTAALLVVPTERSICDASPISAVTAPRALLGGAVALGIAVLAVRRRGPAMLLLLSLLPSLQLVPVSRWWSPHYAYVPLVFVSMLVADELTRATRRATAVVVAVVALAALSLHDDRRFVSDEHLFGAEVAAQPACREGQFYLGEVARRRGAFAEAEARYDAALAPHPGVLAYVDAQAALVNLGVAQLEQGKLAPAEVSFERALAVTHDALARRKVIHNLAGVALGRGDPVRCLDLLREELARPDAFPESIALAARARSTTVPAR